MPPDDSNCWRGYRTGHFAKWHFSTSQTQGAPKPEKYGIDEFAVFNRGAGWRVADLHTTAANADAFISANNDKKLDQLGTIQQFIGYMGPNTLHPVTREDQ